MRRVGVEIGQSITIKDQRYIVAARCFINGNNKRCPVIGKEYLYLLRQINGKLQGAWHAILK